MMKRVEMMSVSPEREVQMYFLDSTTMVQLVLERQRDLTKQAAEQSFLASNRSHTKRNGRSLQHSAGAALVRIGRHLQA